MEASDTFPITLDVFRLNELGDVGERIVPFLQHVGCTLPSVVSGELLQAEFETGTDLTAVAATATPANLVGVQHQSFTATTGGLQCSTQAGVARTNDQDVNPFWQWALGHYGPWRRLPPIGLLLKFWREGSRVDRGYTPDLHAHVLCGLAGGGTGSVARVGSNVVLIIVRRVISSSLATGETMVAAGYARLSGWLNQISWES